MKISDCTTPFQVGIVTDATADLGAYAATARSRGNPLKLNSGDLTMLYYYKLSTLEEKKIPSWSSGPNPENRINI